LLPSARALHLVRQSAFGVRIRLGGCRVGYGYALAHAPRHSGYAYTAYTSRHDSSPTLSSRHHQQLYVTLVRYLRSDKMQGIGAQHRILHGLQLLLKIAPIGHSSDAWARQLSKVLRSK
jgi:hypothetical protein